jgi:UDP-galactopyranose mutase
VQYKILAFADGQLVPFPVNLDTVNTLLGTSYNCRELEEYYKGLRLQKANITNSEDWILSNIGEDLYEKFFKHYTKKHWGLWPRELDKSVCARIPVRTNRDARYFGDKYQAMPKYGYTRLFHSLLHHSKIHVLLNTDYRQIIDDLKYDKMIYTGPIDEYFNCKYGKLPYRSLKFEHETLPIEFYQPVSQVNYPNDYDFTRIVEIKHATGQKHHSTTIVREYSSDIGDPYYPIPMPKNEDLFRQYKKEAEKLNNVYFIGRLAEYRYFNMDQVVDNALSLFQKISQ